MQDQLFFPIHTNMCVNEELKIEDRFKLSMIYDHEALKLTDISNWIIPIKQRNQIFH